MAVYFYNPIDSEQKKANDYLLAIEEKHASFDKVPAPRLIFMGGSSVAFGTSAQQMEVPAVNLGLHAGLGVSFMVNEAMELAQKGDVLVVSTEYFLGEGDKPLLAYLVKQVPSMEKTMNLHPFEKWDLAYSVWIKDFHEVVKRVQSTVVQGKETVQSQDVNTLYTRSGFNPQGDYIQHLGKERPWGLFVRYSLEDRPYQEEIATLNKLTALKAKGVDVVYVFPPFADTEFEKNKKAILSFERQMRKDLKFPILGRPEDFVYPENDFYDTAYHLNLSGREKRGQTLKLLLAPYLEKLKR